MLKILFTLKKPVEDVLALLKGYSVETLREDESLLPRIAKGNYDIILLEGEIDILPAIKATDPRVEVIFFGEQKEDTIEAIRRGATAYFSYPVEIERLRETIGSISNIAGLRAENAELERLLTTKYTFFNSIVGRNPQMLEIITLIRRIAPYYKTVTIMGETGIGKELVARALHSLGPSEKNPFIVCNCGALVETLVESELFGHKKGAFTGAVEDKIGLFEAAGEGTIFLDEIGELPPSIQPRLLRVLQDGEFRPVGSNLISKAKCRVIAATNKDLAKEVKNRRFREDLFYRITPLTIHIPPIRERKDDIPFLCRHFLEKFNARMGKKIFGISRPAQVVFLSYDWPGNVRELENIIEQAVLLATESFIRVSDLPPHIREPLHEVTSEPLSLDSVEKKHIEAVLKQCDGNRSMAAKLLGISRKTLFRKIVRYSI